MYVLKQEEKVFVRHLMVKSIPQHFENVVSSNVSADSLAWLGIPAQTSMIGPRMGYREGRPFMNRWIYVFSPNDLRSSRGGSSLVQDLH